MKQDKYGQYDLDVYVYTRPFLRDPNLEFEMFIGRHVLENCFDRMKVDESIVSLTLSFPENWLNILEQRQLLPRLAKYCPNLEKVVIKTHSVYIIQCTPNGCCLIIQNDQQIQEDKVGLEEHLYVENVGNFFDVNKLNIC